MTIVFTPEYGKLYENHEQGVYEEFNYECSEGCVRYTFLKRTIPYQVRGETYYDITSPYGFGGPIITNATDKKAVYMKFLKAFRDYCHEENIIAEFIRFHPFINDDLVNLYDGEAVNVGMQVIRNLTLPDSEELTGSTRWEYRRAIKNGLSVSFEEDGSRLDEFLRLYNGTMNRNEADDFYYFPREFFERLHRDLKGHFVYIFVEKEEKVISSAIILTDEVYCYAFLAGTDEEYLNDKASLYLIVESIGWLQKQKAKYLLLGGGHGGEDGIYHFKRKFAKTGDYPYYIGKKIMNQNIYQTLVEMRSKESDFDPKTTFFPAYRANFPNDQFAKAAME